MDIKFKKYVSTDLFEIVGAIAMPAKKKQGLVIKIKTGQKATQVAVELEAYLKIVKPMAEVDGYEGFAFIGGHNGK